MGTDFWAFLTVVGNGVACIFCLSYPPVFFVVYFSLYICLQKKTVMIQYDSRLRLRYALHIHPECSYRQ